LSHILVCSVPNSGHFGPMFAIAERLKKAGHQITFYSGANFRDKVESAGIRFTAIAEKAKIDFRDPALAADGRSISGNDQRLHLMKLVVDGDALWHQHEGLLQILQETPIDLILVDTVYFSIFPLTVRPREERPLVIGCGVNPLMLGSRDCTLLLPPDNTPEGQRHIWKENRNFQALFQPIQDRIDSILSDHGVSPLPHFFFDCMYLLPDLFLQFTAESFEFPRSDMPDKIHFIGPVLPKPSTGFEEPAWWSELDGSKPVVLVTQGTLANKDLTELIQPSLSGLAEEDVIVVVAAGRDDFETLDIPANARVVPFIPFDRILSKTDVLITNCGYGAVNHALSLGVPIVAAGDTEDKDWIAARIAWTGAGINLKTMFPNPEQIRNAVRAIITNKKYHFEAQRMRADFARYDALNELTVAVNGMLTRNISAAISETNPVYAD
jgi:MGT family glycosyltransferase